MRFGTQFCTVGIVFRCVVFSALVMLVRVSGGGVWDTKGQVLSCLLTIQLDDKPFETRWEIRGPLPSSGLVDGVTYYYYNQTNELVEEALELQEGGRYYLMFADLEDNGINNGWWKLAIDESNNNYPSDGAKGVLGGEDGDFGKGKLYEIAVPSVSRPNHGEEGILIGALRV